MRSFYSFVVCSLLVLSAVNTKAQLAFEASNNRLSNAAFHSGTPTAVVDWNKDGLDDIVRLQYGRSVYVEIQVPGNQYETRYLGDFATGNGGWGWAMCVADLNNDGYKDIVAGGRYTDLKVMLCANNGNSGVITTVPNSNFFIQSMTIGDFNQDGSLDVFVCDDNAASHIYTNNGSGVLTASSMINFDITPSDDSGNYGSVYTDFDNDGDLDLYIAKCRQNITDTNDFRRINLLFVNDGNGNYTEMAATYNVNIHWQSWTASFGDTDNDGDLDLFVTNHDHASQLLLNDGTGHYTDATANCGINISNMTPLQSVIEDFDNDGLADILVAGSTARLFLNSGNNVFIQQPNPFDNNNMETFAIGDLNHDGFIDIYGGYGNIYTTPSTTDDVLWLNKGNKNHFFSLDLRGNSSNQDGIGARALIYGSWGVQIRESKSGESYGTTNTAMLHFGLGNATAIDSVVIHWPGGSKQTISNPSIDQFLQVSENNCISPEAILTSTNADAVLCTGQSMTLTAPAGMNYLWSTGDITQSINITTAGEYLVRISQNGNNCYSSSRLIKVLMNPDEKPLIEASGALDFCLGNSVTLTGIGTALAYNWSNGQSNQSIQVTSGGNYWLETTGHCQNWNSDTLSIQVYQVATPSAGNITLNNPGVAILTASSNTTLWHTSINSPSVYQGLSYTTPTLNQTTSYYIRDEQTFGYNDAHTGMLYPSALNLYNATTVNANTNFDVMKACVLESVKVYTDTYGDRLIELYDAQNNLLDSKLVNVNADSMIVSLNFNLVPGNGYSLRTNDSINGLLPGMAGGISPRLNRSNANVSYPYTASNGTIEITGNDVFSTFYYYFYDWKVAVPGTTCTSDWDSVQVTVNNAQSISENPYDPINIYPNPAKENCRLQFTDSRSRQIKLYDTSGKIILDLTSQEASVILPTYSLSSGLYQIQVNTNEQEQRLKLIIE